MKKIIHITKFFPEAHGGIETLTENTCKILSKKYNNIDIVSFSKTEKSQKVLKLKKINIIKFPTNIIIRSTPVSFKMLFFFIKNINKYDIIHLYFPNPWIAFLGALTIKKDKKILVSWGSDIIKQKYLKYLILPFQNYILNKAYKIIILSKNYFYHSNDLKKFKKKVILIPLALSVKNNKFSLNKKKKLIILNIGRLVEYKNQRIFFDIANKINKNIEINIIGNGPLHSNFKEIIKKNKLNKKIKLLTNVNNKDLIKYIKLCDIFCFTSNTRAESFGIVVLEALSYKKPLLIFNNKGSGMLDMIKNNYNGYIFNSKKNLIEKINYIEKNRYLMKKFSTNSQKLFKLKYDKKIIYSKLFSLYDDLLK